MTSKTLDNKIQIVKETLQIQKDNTRLNDKYMVGLYNGLELALAYMEEREPIYLKVEELSPLGILR